jgi:hypothetical protein
MCGVGHLEARKKCASKVDSPKQKQQQQRTHKGQLNKGCTMIGFAEDT